MIYDVVLKGLISAYVQNKLLHLVLETKMLLQFLLVEQWGFTKTHNKNKNK